MKVNIVCPILVLENEKSLNVRKNDQKHLKLLVSNDNELLNVPLTKPVTLKDELRTKIKEVIGSNNFHLEQVYTLGEDKYFFDNTLSIIYLAITNIENIKKLSSSYKLIDFKVNDNYITLDNNSYKFKTKEKISNNNIEYIHEFNLKDIKLEKILLEILISYKYLRSRLDNTDIMFKLLSKTFTLEEVRIVYEMLTETKVDKSNFRKKIIKYCKEVEGEYEKKGYRPSKLYEFKLLKEDIWL